MTSPFWWCICLSSMHWHEIAAFLTQGVLNVVYPEGKQHWLRNACVKLSLGLFSLFTVFALTARMFHCTHGSTPAHIKELLEGKLTLVPSQALWTPQPHWKSKNLIERNAAKNPPNIKDENKLSYWPVDTHTCQQRQQEGEGKRQGSKRGKLKLKL